MPAESSIATEQSSMPVSTGDVVAQPVETHPTSSNQDVTVQPQPDLALPEVEVWLHSLIITVV